MPREPYPRTPDGRYFVARGRLWRCTNPSLTDTERRAHVKALMKARNAVRLAADEAGERVARAAVHEAKVALGERGAVWWDDGAPDENRKAPWNSSYAAWWDDLDPGEQAAGIGTPDRSE